MTYVRSPNLAASIHPLACIHDSGVYLSILEFCFFVIFQGFAHAAGPLVVGLLSFCCLVLFFLNGSACAGSLVIGCWLPGHVLKTTMISEADAIICFARNYLSAGLVPPFWDPGERCWQLGCALGDHGSNRKTSWCPESNFE